MGKHAAPRKPLLSRPASKRATAVSLGTFVLCLGAAAPAAAATISPTPPPIPQPIADTVQQISDATGVPNPIAEVPTTGSHHHRTSKHTPTQHAPAGDSRNVNRTSTRATHAVAPTYAPSVFALAALHNPQGRTAALAGRQPAVAQPAVTRIAPAAAHRALISLPGSPAQQDTERILLVAAATLLLGGLASGHLKAAQRRMIAW